MDRESIQELHNAARKVERSLFDSRDHLHLSALNTGDLDAAEQKMLDDLFESLSSSYTHATMLAERLAMLLRKRKPIAVRWGPNGAAEIVTEGAG